jgi:hypothetical protein
MITKQFSRIYTLLASFNRGEINEEQLGDRLEAMAERSDVSLRPARCRTVIGLVKFVGDIALLEKADKT